jgi:hypothetical protein
MKHHFITLFKMITIILICSMLQNCGLIEIAEDGNRLQSSYTTLLHKLSYFDTLEIPSSTSSGSTLSYSKDRSTQSSSTEDSSTGLSMIYNMHYQSFKTLYETALSRLCILDTLNIPTDIDGYSVNGSYIFNIDSTRKNEINSRCNTSELMTGSLTIVVENADESTTYAKKYSTTIDHKTITYFISHDITQVKLLLTNETASINSSRVIFDYDYSLDSLKFEYTNVIEAVDQITFIRGLILNNKISLIFGDDITNELKSYFTASTTPLHYTFSNTKSSWLNAESACNANKGSLAYIPTQDSYDKIKSLYSDADTDDSYWIGLNDRDSEGIFKWIMRSSEPADFLTPLNNTQQDDCFKLTKQNSLIKIHAAQCNQQTKYICEIPQQLNAISLIQELDEYEFTENTCIIKDTGKASASTSFPCQTDLRDASTIQPLITSFKETLRSTPNWLESKEILTFDSSTIFSDDI